MLRNCKGVLVEKMRYMVRTTSRIWLVDVYCGECDGLLAAKTELAADADGPDSTDWPDGIMQDATGDPAFANARLASHRLPPSEKAP